MLSISRFPSGLPLFDSGLGVVISTTSRCGIPLPFDLPISADGSPFHPPDLHGGGHVFAGLGIGAHPAEMLNACATGKTALPKGAGKLADENELFKQVGGGLAWRKTGERPSALWARSTKNPDVITGPFARPFAQSFTCLLAPHCSLRLCAPLRSLVCSLAHFAHSLPRGKVNYCCLKITWFYPIVH